MFIIIPLPNTFIKWLPTMIFDPTNIIICCHGFEPLNDCSQRGINRVNTWVDPYGGNPIRRGGPVCPPVIGGPVGNYNNSMNVIWHYLKCIQFYVFEIVFVFSTTIFLPFVRFHLNSYTYTGRHAGRPQQYRRINIGGFGYRWWQNKNHPLNNYNFSNGWIFFGADWPL